MQLLIMGGLLNYKGEMMKAINCDEDGIYSIQLDQAEIIMLVSGYIPYVVFESDPEIPNNEFLWIHYEPKENDFIPELDPFPCRILSYVSFANQNNILTLAPEEFDLDFIDTIEEFKANMERAGEIVRSTASLSPNALSKAALTRRKLKGRAADRREGYDP